MRKYMAGIVLFNPDIERLKENINAICKQVRQILLVDNFSKNIDKIEELCMNYENITIIRNTVNLGIAAALNQIMRYGEEEGYDWILTLDQDSVCPNNIMNEFEQYTSIENAAIICPVIIDRNKLKLLNNEKCDFKYKEIRWCITSGSLMNTKAWNDIGGLDENMFIDGVDYEYCIRLTQKKYKILQIQSVQLLHEIGKIKIQKFLFYNIAVMNHNAFRKYYITKNIIYVSKKHFGLKHRAFANLRILKLLAITLLYEDNKKEKMYAILKGIKDGYKITIK